MLVGVAELKLVRRSGRKTVWRFIVIAPLVMGCAVWSFYLSVTDMLLLSSIAMFACGAIYQIWGLPKQVWLNHKRGTVEGQASVAMWSGAAAYSTSTFRALLMRDWWMVASRAPGMVGTVLILMQSFAYGRPEPEDNREADDFRQDEEAFRLARAVGISPFLTDQAEFERNPDGSVSFHVYSGRCPQGTFPDLSVFTYSSDGGVVVNEMDDVH